MRTSRSDTTGACDASIALLSITVRLEATASTGVRVRSADTMMTPPASTASMGSAKADTGRLANTARPVCKMIGITIPPSLTRPGAHDAARGRAQNARHHAARTRTVELSLREDILVRPAHPVRTKNDCDGQVSWLAGQRRFGRLLRTLKVPMASGRWLTAHSCRGSRGLEPRSLLIPLRGTCRNIDVVGGMCQAIKWKKPPVTSPLRCPAGGNALPRASAMSARGMPSLATIVA